jgi:hypothetical protein
VDCLAVDVAELAHALDIPVEAAMAAGEMHVEGMAILVAGGRWANPATVRARISRLKGNSSGALRRVGH